MICMSYLNILVDPLIIAVVCITQLSKYLSLVVEHLHKHVEVGLEYLVSHETYRFVIGVYLQFRDVSGGLP